MFTAALLTAASLLAAQPAVPTKATPLEVLATTRFNAALVDEVLLHHWVDLTGTVTDIKRDGIGGYLVKLEGQTHEPDFIGRIEITCHFAGTYSHFSGVQHYFAGNTRNDLARIKPGVPVTIRGVFRELKDHLHFPIDKNVEMTMKECEVVVAAP